MPQDTTGYKVIQMTDCHLFKDDSLMNDVQTYQTFKRVIQHIKIHELHDTSAIFLTGDLSQDETEESYQLLLKEFADIDLNVYWIPGNHDHYQRMKHVFSQKGNFYNIEKLTTKNWNFLFLNTQKEGEVAGYLSEQSLVSLNNHLKQDSKIPTAIIMHHPPSFTGTPMIDSSILQDSDKFWEAITGYNVKLVMCGHVHGDYTIRYTDDITIEASPSTCIQFVKGATTPQFEKKIGYKVYYFGIDSYESRTVLWDI